MRGLSGRPLCGTCIRMSGLLRPEATGEVSQQFLGSLLGGNFLNQNRLIRIDPLESKRRTRTSHRRAITDKVLLRVFG